MGNINRQIDPNDLQTVEGSVNRSDDSIVLINC